MADSNATPALYKLPLELAAAISSFSDVSSLDSISRASKVCRQLFAPYLLEEVRFDGSQASLTCLLRGFLQSPADALVVGLRDHIKCATIVVHSNPVTWGKAANSFRDVKELPMQILNSIQLMGNLHTLALDLDALPEDQEVDLVTALRSTEPWRLRHLRVSGQELLGGAVIKHCCPNMLKILQIAEGADSSDCFVAAKHCKGLERLQVFGAPDASWWASLKRITTDFAHLQWLVLSEREEECGGFTNKFLFISNYSEYDEVIGQLETILKELPSLRYFAFSLRLDQVDQMLDPDEDTAPNDFYEALIDRVSDALPKLRQLCVMIEWPNMWRGVRTEDGEAMYTEYEYLNKTIHFNRVFPVGLGDQFGES